MKEYTLSKSIDPCKLSRDDLEQLISIIQAGFEDTENRKDNLQISATHSGVRIAENDLNLFLAHAETPKVLTEISISMTGWDHQRNINKCVYLSLSNSWDTLDVRSSDQTWALGKLSQITNYLKSKRIFFWFLKAPVIYMILGVVNAIATVSLFSFLFLLVKKGFNSIPTYLPFIMFASGVLALVLSRFKHVRIITKQEQSFIEKNGDTLGLLIALLSFIATVIFGLLTLKK